MLDIMAEMLRTPNDAYSINHATIAQKIQVQIQRTVVTSLYCSGPREKTKILGGKLFAGHVIARDLIRQDVIYLEEGH